MNIISIIFPGLILCFGTLNAQDTDLIESGMKSIRKNSVYLEMLGNAAVWSVNYDRTLPVSKNTALFVRIGGNEYHGIDTDNLSINLLGAIGFLYGGPKRFLDAGIGYTHFSGYPDRLTIISGGYRFQGPKGLVIKAAPMYIYNKEKGDVFGNIVWFGLSFGYSF